MHVCILFSRASSRSQTTCAYQQSHSKFSKRCALWKKGGKCSVILIFVFHYNSSCQAILVFTSIASSCVQEYMFPVNAFIDKNRAAIREFFDEIVVLRSFQTHIAFSLLSLSLTHTRKRAERERDER